MLTLKTAKNETAYIIQDNEIEEINLLDYIIENIEYVVHNNRKMTPYFVRKNNNNGYDVFGREHFYDKFNVYLYESLETLQQAEELVYTLLTDSLDNQIYYDIDHEDLIDCKNYERMKYDYCEIDEYDLWCDSQNDYYDRD
jgi:hypothetical protein